AKNAAGSSCATRTAVASRTPPKPNATVVIEIHTPNSAARNAPKTASSRPTPGARIVLKIAAMPRRSVLTSDPVGTERWSRSVASQPARRGARDATKRSTMTTIRAALVQTTWTGDKESMIKAHEEYARQAADQGARVICFQELFY